MPIINTELTPVEIAKSRIEQNIRLLKSQCISMLRLYQTTIKSVWNNPTASPEDIVASFDTDALELFQLSNTLAAALSALLPLAGGQPIETVVPENYTWTVELDGGNQPTGRILLQKNS